MKKLNTITLIMQACIITIAFTMSSCKKTNIEKAPITNLEQAEINSLVTNAPTPPNPNFNLQVILHGEDKGFGLVKFRQDNDVSKIVSLGIWVRDLQPDHEYKLQRAVDTNIDDNCTGTAWLTLGKGLQPQSIFTDANGTGREELWRNLSAFPSGATFDIHFRVIDAVSSVAVLISECY